MSLKVIIESTVKEGAFEQLLPFLEANLPNVRGFNGCLNVTVFFNTESRKMIFDEQWVSAEDHKKYLDTIANNGVMGELVSLIETPPEVKYFHRVDI